ncbi:hypothetical protein SAMN05216365_13935 [Porphyromonadaceae bacterium NLAE-zl-C104]|jgi:hypothetical protein|nr:hypothetical protein JS578_12630 [Dysgonomonadaceae bacterium zrk40]SFS99560.1 hypothetical protein SAMN05216365_13935 [Porphyromonadaceae bacterium NLAE-zl-C104]
MKKSEIIDLAIKILGIHVIIVGLLYLKDLHYLKSLFTKYDNSSIDSLALILFLGGGIITFTIGYLLIFKSKFVTSILSKDDSDFQIGSNINYEKTLDLALILIGVIILIFRFPGFISTIYRFISYLFGNMRNPYDFLMQDIGYFIHYLFGYILITNSKSISKWIIKTNRKNSREIVE